MTDVVTQENTQPTLGERIAEVSTAKSGTMTFFLINAGIFGFWIVLNTLAPPIWQYDKYPFAFLTLSVSLEAIFLSILVLISQNRRAEAKVDALTQDMQVIKRMLAKAVVE